MKYLLGTVLLLTLTGCGAFDRLAAKVTGEGTETCQDGVIYLQFTSGTSVKYLPNGSIATCKESK